jgi:hypothetical protein
MEMIKGAKYTWNGKWFTFVEPSQTYSRMGLFRDDSGKIQVVLMDVFESAPSKEPTPFPEPERWAQHQDWIHHVKFSAKESKGFCAASEIASASAVNQHNAEIDRLMSEIRRLEALVQK